VLVLALIFFFIYVFYHFFFFAKLIFHNPSVHIPNDEKPISIIICAHNEAENLRQNLPYFLHQSYGNYEVVVVNDASNDDTAMVLQEFEKEYENLSVLHIAEKNEHWKGKKYALQQGILFSKNEHIALSDADCKPIKPNWLQQINAHLHQHNIVLGISPYYYENNFLARFINYETLHTAILYSSFALRNKAYMSVGRNAAYHKSVLSKADFAAIASIPSGDDDLLFQQVCENETIGVMLQPESFTFSAPKSNWQAYYNQKSRHFSTGKLYQNKHKFWIALYAFAQSFLYLSLIILLFYKLKIALLLLLSSIYLHTRMFKFIALRWQWRISLFDIIKFEMLYIVFYIIFSPIIFLKNKMQWK